MKYNQQLGVICKQHHKVFFVLLSGTAKRDEPQDLRDLSGSEGEKKHF